ncbi:hypothetical protein GY45DRAFT_1341614, partial [Cubamyces sp. BRFM 1775]
VERVVCLWRYSGIVLRQDGKPFRPKKRNTSTGKESRTKTDFSATNFLPQTTHFKKSAHRLSAEHMESLLTAAVNHIIYPTAPLYELDLGEHTLGRDELVEPDDSEDEVRDEDDVSLSILVTQGQPTQVYCYSDMVANTNAADTDAGSDSGSDTDTDADHNTDANDDDGDNSNNDGDNSSGNGNDNTDDNNGGDDNESNDDNAGDGADADNSDNADTDADADNDNDNDGGDDQGVMDGSDSECEVDEDNDD